VSVRIVSRKPPFRFAYGCDSCERPYIVADVLPAGWEAVRSDDGRLEHICSLCWFDRLIESLEQEVSA
jgi:hypothetical protein